MPSSDSDRRMLSAPKDSRTSSVIGAKPAHVDSQEDEVKYDENRRYDHQLHIVARCSDQREDEESERTDHHVQPGAEEEVHLAHIVGGARHGIAHRLQVMEGHALAEQVGVKLTPHIAFHLLRGKFKTKIARKLQ